MKKLLIAAGTLSMLSIGAQAFESDSAQMYLRGSFDDWDTGTQMRLIGDNLWETSIMLEQGDAIKFDTYGDWTRNFGDNEQDRVAEASGSNIIIPEDATYHIQFNEQTKAYSLLVQVTTGVTTNSWEGDGRLGGMPLQIFVDGEQQADGSITRGYHGSNWYLGYHPIGSELRIVLDNQYTNPDPDRPSTIYQGELSMSVAANNQDMLVAKSCGGIAARVTGTHAGTALSCVNGTWQGILELGRYPGSMEHTHIALTTTANGDITYFGDDHADGVALELKAIGTGGFPISVPWGYTYEVSFNPTTLAYSYDAIDTVTFETYISVPSECHLEVRGNQAPLSWNEGIALSYNGIGYSVAVPMPFIMVI